MRSISASAFSGVVLNVTSSPVATPFVEWVVKVRWLCTSTTGKRGFSTRVSGT